MNTEGGGGYDLVFQGGGAVKEESKGDGAARFRFPRSAEKNLKLRYRAFGFSRKSRKNKSKI